MKVRLNVDVIAVMRGDMAQAFEADPMPRGYGLAWMDPVKGKAIAYPKPFHLVARVVRTYWMRASYVFLNRDPYMASFQLGFRTGFHAGTIATAGQTDALLRDIATQEPKKGTVH